MINETRHCDDYGICQRGLQLWAKHTLILPEDRLGGRPTVEPTRPRSGARCPLPGVRCERRFALASKTPGSQWVTIDIGLFTVRILTNHIWQLRLDQVGLRWLITDSPPRISHQSSFGVHRRFEIYQRRCLQIWSDAPVAMNVKMAYLEDVIYFCDAVVGKPPKPLNLLIVFNKALHVALFEPTYFSCGHKTDK